MSSGKIITWNRRTGSGFIKSDEFDSRVFVHISAFPEGSIMPRVGDDVIFSAEHTPKGISAYQVFYKSKSNTTPTPKKRKKSQYRTRPNIDKLLKRQSRNPLSTAVLACGVLAFCLSVYYGMKYYPIFAERYLPSPTPADPIAQTQKTQPILAIIANQQKDLKCGTKTQCHQMHSQSEAQWYLNHCPDVAKNLDSNGDGYACDAGERVDSVDNQ